MMASPTTSNVEGPPAGNDRSAVEEFLDDRTTLIGRSESVVIPYGPVASCPPIEEAAAPVA
jgi:hypothetical protein